MSYILDALKKADRERNLSRVPTLTTVHVSVYAAGRRVALWVVAVVLVSGGLTVWLLRASPTGIPAAPVASAPGVDFRSSVTAPDPERISARPEVLDLPSPAVKPAPRRLPAPSAQPQRDARRQSEREPTPDPGPSVRGSSQAPQSVLAPVASPEVGVRPMESAPTAPARSAVPEKVEPPQTRVEPVAPVPPPAPAAPPSLRAALEKMTLDVFVYTNVEADRMVVINGRRYVQGQLIEGVYLLEAIVPDGVVLSYQGERVVLRP